MLNFAGNNSFSELVSGYLKVFDHYTWVLKFKVLNSDFQKIRILEMLNFHPYVCRWVPCIVRLLLQKWVHSVRLSLFDRPQVF